MSDLIYVIGDAKKNAPFKIGSSSEERLVSRFSSIQTGNPNTLHIIQTFLVPYGKETTEFEHWLRNSLVKKFPNKYKAASGEWVALKTGKQINRRTLVDDLKKVLGRKDYIVHKDDVLKNLILRANHLIEERNKQVKENNKQTSSIFNIFKSFCETQNFLEKQSKKIDQVFNEIHDLKEDRLLDVNEHGDHNIDQTMGDFVNQMTKPWDEFKHPKAFKPEAFKKVNKKNNSFPVSSEKINAQVPVFLEWMKVFYNMFLSTTHHRRDRDSFLDMSNVEEVILTFNRSDLREMTKRYIWQPNKFKIDYETVLRKEEYTRYIRSDKKSVVGRFFISGQSEMYRKWLDYSHEKIHDNIYLDIGELAKEMPEQLHLIYADANNLNQDGYAKTQSDDFYSYNSIREKLKEGYFLKEDDEFIRNEEGRLVLREKKCHH